MRRIYFNPPSQQPASQPASKHVDWRSARGVLVIGIGIHTSSLKGEKGRWQNWQGSLGPTKLRIHNSFIWPYLHILLLLLRPLDGPLRRKKRAEIGIWLAFVANILAFHFVLPLCLAVKGGAQVAGQSL